MEEAISNKENPEDRYAVIFVKVRNEGVAYISWQGPTMPKVYLEVRNGSDYPHLMYLSFVCESGFRITYNDENVNESISSIAFPSGQFPISAPIQFTEIQGGRFSAASNLQTLYAPIGDPNKRDWSRPSQALEGSLLIAGENPPKSEIENYVHDTVLYKICREFSNFEMFDNNGKPKFNTTRNGYGLFALEHCNANERWNWKANIESARAMYNNNIVLSNNYSNDMCRRHRRLPPMTDLQLKVNAAQLFDKIDSDNYWMPQKNRFLFFWHKWNWVPKVAGGNRLGDRVQK